jgi:predicted dehydrogenase
VQQAVFGLIGAGGIAQSQHLPNLTRAPHAQLKTVCDLREDVLARMQAKYAVPHATTDYRELLADPEVDAVVVATREDHQAQLTIEALKAGKHVYVEKPLATTPQEAAAVVEAQREAGRHVAVGFNRRFAPAYVRAREILHADGGPRNVHYRISDEYWRWGRGFPPNTRIIHEVCHIFDLLRWLTGSDPETVYCLDSRPDDEAIVLGFPGCVATIMSSGFCTMDLPKERLEAVSDLGTVIVEEFCELRAYGYRDVDWIQRFAGHSHPDREYTPKHLLALGGAEAMAQLRRMGWEQRERLEREPDSLGPDEAELKDYQSQRSPHWNYMVDKGWLHAMDHFAECIVTGHTPRNASAADGLWSSRLSAAAIASREQGVPVRLDAVAV